MDLSKPLAQLAVCLHDTNTRLFLLSQSIAHAKADQEKRTAGLPYKRSLFRYLKDSKLRIQGCALFKMHTIYCLCSYCCLYANIYYQNSLNLE